MLLGEVQGIIRCYLERVGVPICQCGISGEGKTRFAFFLLTRRDELDCHIQQLQRKLASPALHDADKEESWLGPPHDYGALRIVLEENPFHPEDTTHCRLVHLELEFGAGSSTCTIYATAPASDPNKIIEAVRDLLRQRERIDT
jgi:hypothetical protein